MHNCILTLYIQHECSSVSNEQSEVAFSMTMLGKHEVNQAKCRKVTPGEGISSESAHLAPIKSNIVDKCRSFGGSPKINGFIRASV